MSPLPARRGQAVPFFAAPSLRGASVAWSRAPGRFCHTLIIKATARIEAEGALKLDDVAGPLRGDEPEGRDAMGAVTYASDGVPIKSRADVLVWAVARRAEPEAEVAFRLGTVVHQRARLRGRAGGPVGHLPLSWTAAAYDSDDNPVGVPVDHARISGDGPWAPVRLHWPCRQRHLGTYDERWYATRFPNYAEDFHPRALQSAPEGQQVDALRGDESFRFEGLRDPTHVLEGQLPGVIPRAFAMRPGTAMERVDLRLDTVAFDLEAMQVDLVWRGVVDVADRRATDVAAWFATLDARLDEPRCREAFWLLRGPVAPYEARGSGARDEVAEHDDRVEAARRARDRLASAGVAPDLLANTAEIRQVAEGPLFSAVANTQAERVKQASRAGVLAEPEARKWLTPQADPQRQAVLAWLAGKGERPRIVGAELSELDFSGRDLSAWSLRGCHLAGCRFDGCDLTEAELGDADATGASFVRAMLVRADLQGACLDRVDAREASMTDANLTRVSAVDARLDAVEAAGAMFTDGLWRQARFTNARLDGASFEASNLDRADFAGAQMNEVRLYEAHALGASFVDANLTGLRADGALLRSARCEGVRAHEAVFDGADLRRSSWTGATLTGISLVGTQLAGAEMARVSAREARASEADLSSANLRGSDWMAADFSHAVLSDADVREASLFGAELRGASTDGLSTKGTNSNRTLLKPT